MSVDRLKKLIENPRYTKKKIKLKDGRILSYSECGNVESGMPVLFCFGLMTSSVAIMFAHQAALQNNLRVVAVDYPGIGESTFQEGRTLSGWADDMNQFCDKVLGSYGSRIRLLGHSLGGLHALALLSDRSFKERIVRTVLLNPWIYFNGTEELHPQWITLAQTLPEVFRSSIIPAVLSKLSLGSINLAGWSNPHHTQLQAAKIISSYATLQGSAGNEQMVRLALSNSELYIPSNLRSPVIVYHGSRDHLVLLESVTELVKQMNERNCSASLVTVENADHNSILSEPNNLSKVMGSIVGEPDAWAKEIMDSLLGKSRSLPTPTNKAKPPPPKTLSPEEAVRKGRSLPTKLFGVDYFED